MTDHPNERFSPLHDVHVAAGASFTDFAGWQMPVRYSSDLAEHHAVRGGAALFDLSHMAEITVTGPDAAAALDFALAGKISAITLGQAKYSLLLSPEGGIIDDVVVYRTHENRYCVVANAGNRFEAADALTLRASEFDAAVVDESDQLALIAVQGPKALEILLTVPELELAQPVADLRYYRSTLGTYRGAEIMVGRTGYTGEDGFELYLANAHAAQLWADLMGGGAEYGIVPAGLASRDTLRLEAGMPLYGHELGLETFPVQAGLGRVVNLGKEGDFVGRAAVEAGPAADARVLVGLAAEGKRAGRAGYAVVKADGTEVGTITSGALSPTLGHPIAMAYVDPAVSAIGTPLFLDVRGTTVPASVIPLPFYKRETN
ncbi:glycine cleavage system aminomethyltransferase GcvT [Lacisediminihabitans changchengi]|uniref:Aminomethyltransferase n=1 Tax=Lacisediminihabitans changchengi TaxID=2787634 RepID=A0A934W3K2_9MICO|nr:glycine cleavage system aminomethyltransferase GcvT [Lacisediminihabitans changchengi]MBK4347314.1 glycine cleavage system aminomethyltransferase GcvT [Lacisediminihabitans changchengi]